MYGRPLLCLLHCSQTDGPHQPPSQPVWNSPSSYTLCGGKECWSFASISLWPCTLSCRGVCVHCKWKIHCAYKRTRVFRCLRFLLWKVIMSSSYLSSRLSVRVKQLDSYCRNWSEILLGSRYWFLIKIVGKFQFCLKSDESNRRFTWRPTPLMTDAYEGRSYDAYLFSISKKYE